MKNNHTFAVCAYKESKYLEQCIKSLLCQTIKSNIIITTSTPNEYISETASAYGIPLYVNPIHAGIGNDWNFALKKANTAYVTLAHQDDIYYPEFAEQTLNRLSPETLIAFTDYFEITDSGIQKPSRLIKAKRLALLFLNITQHSELTKKLLLSFGTPICCPSVTFNKNKIGNFAFDSYLKCNLDWKAWLEMANKQGAFTYIQEKLVFHRIHLNSETNAQILAHTRQKEDFYILSKIWPIILVKLIQKCYKDYFKAYRVSTNGQ